MVALIFAFLVLVVVVTAVLIRRGEKSFSGSEKRYKVKADVDRAYRAALDSLELLGRVGQSDMNERVAKATTRMSWKTFGDVLELRVAQAGDVSVVSLETWQRIPTTLYAWGKNQDLQSAFARYLRDRVEVLSV